MPHHQRLVAPADSATAAAGAAAALRSKTRAGRCAGRRPRRPLGLCTCSPGRCGALSPRRECHGCETVAAPGTATWQAAAQQRAPAIHPLVLQNAVAHGASGLVAHLAHKDLHLQRGRGWGGGGGDRVGARAGLARRGTPQGPASPPLLTSAWFWAWGSRFRCTTMPLSALLMKWAEPLMSYRLGACPFHSRSCRG